MHQLQATVLSNEPAMDGVNQLWLEAPEVARETQPGQFVMVRCGEGWDPLLRRALSIHRVPPGGSDLCAALQRPRQGYRRAGP